MYCCIHILNIASCTVFYSFFNIKMHLNYFPFNVFFLLDCMRSLRISIETGTVWKNRIEIGDDVCYVNFGKKKEKIIKGIHSMCQQQVHLIFRCFLVVFTFILYLAISIYVFTHNQWQEERKNMFIRQVNTKFS